MWEGVFRQEGMLVGMLKSMGRTAPCYDALAKALTGAGQSADMESPLLEQVSQLT